MKWSSRPKASPPDWRSFQSNSARPRRSGKRSRSVLLPLGLFTFLLLALVSFLFAAKQNCPPPSSGSTQAQARPKAKDSVKITIPLFGQAPRFDRIMNGKYTEEKDSYRLIYSIDPVLQMSVNEILHSNRPPYGAFVAIDPNTGKILALADYARDSPWNAGIWQRATYPAASLFKVITAAAALEKGLLNYDSPVAYRGNQYRLGPQKINKGSKRDRQMSFDEAFGKSNNVVFGRVAAQLVGTENLRRVSAAFGFNRPLLFDFPLEMSKALIPDDFYELARCGAGFGEVTLNPLHAALIAGCIGNGGIMMRPYLVEEIWETQGERLYHQKPEPLAQPICAKTAADLTRMMTRTVEDGTASRIFHRYAKPLMNRMTIGGKTGSLTGDNPPGKYDWFIGFAPAENPKIAFAAMMVNHDRSRLKGAFVAQEVLKTFFRDESN